MKKVLILLSLLIASNTSTAGFYFEFGFEDGGDTLISSEAQFSYGSTYDYEKDLNVGGGGKLAIGVHNLLGEDSDRSLSFSLGYLQDSIDAGNGDADYDTFTFDAIYGFHFDSHRFGVGASYHIGPEYKADVDGFPSVKVEFDDALGVIIQYSYAFTPSFQLGLRLTEMDYEVHDVTLDAGSIGLFIAYTSL